MTRRITKLAALYLLLGLVATWAVAWGSVFVRHRVSSRMFQPGSEEGRTVEFVTRYWGGRSSTLGGVPDLPQLRAARELAEPGEPLWVQTIDWTSGSELRGWPWFAVSCKMVVSRPLRTDPEWLNHWTSVTSRTDRKPDRPRQPGAMHSTDRLPLPLPMPADVEGALLIGTRSHPAARRDVGAVVLPYLPIWPGLLADTLFYALLFAALHQLTAYARRARRRRRNRCAACGYDLQGLNAPTCPECGRALSPARGATATPDRA
jgi:hypothetical protein